MNNTSKIYEKHHGNVKRENFSIMEKERGGLFNKIINENQKILDIGCRDGTLTKYFMKNNNVIGVDVDSNALRKIEKNLKIETIQLDLNDEWGELEDKKFDVIVAAEVLEHLYFPDDIIKKIIKHLNNNGRFIGSVPNAFSLKNRLRYLFGTTKNTPLEDPTHINQFSSSELKRILLANFKQVEIIGLGRFSVLASLLPNMFAFDLVFEAKL